MIALYLLTTYSPLHPILSHPITLPLHPFFLFQPFFSCFNLFFFFAFFFFFLLFTMQLAPPPSPSHHSLSLWGDPRLPPPTFFDRKKD